MRILGVLTALLIAHPATAFADTPAPAQPPASRPEPTAKTKTVCKEIAETGTRFKRKACGRKEDWARLEEESMKARANMGGAGNNTSKTGD